MHKRSGVGRWLSVTAGLMLLAAAFGAGELAARLGEADGLRREGKAAEAGAAYREVVSTGLQANELSAADQVAFADAAVSLAFEAYSAAAGQAGADAQLRLAAEAGAEGTAAIAGERFVQVVGFGQTVDLEQLVTPGHITIVDFSSKYCPPCEAMRPRLSRFAFEHSDVAVLRVDINRPDVRGIDWKSPVAQQFKLQSIPYFAIFGKDAKVQSYGDAAYPLVERMLSGR